MSRLVGRSALLVLVALVGCGGGSTEDPDDDGDGLTLSEEDSLGLDPASADSDGDGLNDGDEVDASTDPMIEDTDGDGLLDGDEAANGADPLMTDTDGDGYSDRDELFEGHDPADPNDRIYKGNWPYVFDKSAIVKNAGDFRQIGNTFYRMKLIDQHGEVVDLYDFYNADKPVVIDISAEWCPPCNAMASWIEGGDDFGNYGSLWPAGPDAIRQKEVYWLTILSEDIVSGPATPELAARWEEEYPSRQVASLADEAFLAPDYTGLAWWPYVMLLEPDLTLSDANDPGADFGSALPVLQELDRRFP